MPKKQSLSFFTVLTYYAAPDKYPENLQFICHFSKMQVIYQLMTSKVTIKLNLLQTINKNKRVTKKEKTGKLIQFYNLHQAIFTLFSAFSERLSKSHSANLHLSNHCIVSPTQAHKPLSLAQMPSVLTF